MDAKLEIRKLQPSNLRELVKILEYNGSWKQLMSMIPRTLEKDNFSCNISSNNPPKYNSEHIRLIENASFKIRKDCAEILFDEWGTSGRVRPTLGHLLQLLVTAQLFRAADYVAIELLHVAPPARPLIGPAALVSTTLSDDDHPNGIRALLDNIRYPSSISNLNSESDARNTSTSDIVIPEIVVTEDSDRNVIETNHANERNSGGALPESVSDMIHFSESQPQSDVNNHVTTNDSVEIPAISSLLHKEEENNEASNTNNSTSYHSNESYQSTTKEESNIPNLSGLIGSNGRNLSTESGDNNPLISVLMGSKSKNESELIPNISMLNNTGLSRSADNIYNSQTNNENIPNLSGLNKTSSMNFEDELVPNFSALQRVPSRQEKISVKENIINERSQNLLNSGSLPHLSSLLMDKSNNVISKSSLFLPMLEGESKLQSGTSSEASKDSLPSFLSNKNSSTSRRQCISPLPNLSLNTKLPHFTYCQLQQATNDFDETPHTMSCDVNDDLSNSVGRFLGSGAFGSVFLGVGLLDRPVAVKKLFLDDDVVVNVDDPVTKQFKNEVEVLSKYQHENLLSLVGYSCDGPTYCLLYEYIPGGALKDRLQDTVQRLMWTDRLYIAMGTARAISYLHTAYSTPLIHRDIKTANILLDCSNKPKLCDFGIIKLVPNQNTNPSTTVFGTSAYMAPEAFRGDISPKLDTFSFGVVLLELLTSLPPLDESREGCDIVTHVEEVCEHNNISLLLDNKAGSWSAKDINFADKLYAIANKCLLEKKNRPYMVQITKELSELIELVK